jgi:hypothetical protein
MLLLPIHNRLADASTNPNGSTPSRSLVESRRTTSNAAPSPAPVERPMNASSWSAAKNMMTRCGIVARQPQSQVSGAFMPRSPNRRARLGSVMPPTNSCEN